MNRVTCPGLASPARIGTGGEGNRTPVLVAFHANIYMLIRCWVLESRTLHRHTAGSRASAKSIHRQTRSLRRRPACCPRLPL